MNTDGLSLESIATEDIIIGERIRIDLGDISLLAELIKKFGLQNPIRVRAVTVNNNRKYVLISGRRRLEAHKLLHMERILAIVEHRSTDGPQNDRSTK